MSRNLGGFYPRPPEAERRHCKARLLTLTHYGLERLLYRLSISAHAPNFLLKGALLFSL